LTPLVSRVAAASRDERGLILPLALIALVVLAALSGAVLAVGTNEVSVAGNFVRNMQAQYLAEAGLEDAFHAFMTDPTKTGVTQAALATVPGLNGASTTLLKYGNYTVQYQTVGGNTVRIVSTGTTTTGATRTLTAYYSNNLTLDFGLLVNGNMTISGNPEIHGTCGSAMINGNLTVSGNGEFDHDLVSSGSYSESGQPSIGGHSGGGYATVQVPNINAADFLTLAKNTVDKSTIYQFKSNGQVLDGYDAVRTTLANGATYRGWTFTAGPPTSWSLSGSTGDDGTYYFEGNATVSGNPGSAMVPWVTSIISTGSVTVSGNPTIRPAVTDTLIIAGGDVAISGSASLGTSLYNGLVAAREQISLTGNSTINGYVIAQGATSNSSVVTGDALNGNPTINYPCGSLAPPLTGSLRFLTWGM
jgi:Tfp pilus assembly protein PilX